MAAQGLLPLAPADLVELLLVLLDDPDSAVAAAAQESLARLPASDCLPIARDRATPEPEPRPGPGPEPVPEPEPVEEISEDEFIVRHLTEEERAQTEKVSAVQAIYRMSLKDKLITALKGTREERSILIRDPNKLVATAVLGSPRLTPAEIEGFSAMKNVSSAVLRTIGNHREWTRSAAVITNLVKNPRTPVGLALTLLPRVNTRDMKTSAVDPNVPRSSGRKHRWRAPADVRERVLRSDGRVAHLRVKGVEYRCRPVEMDDRRAVVLTRANLSAGDRGTLTTTAERSETPRRIVVEELIAIDLSPLSPAQHQSLSGLDGPLESPALAVLGFPGTGTARGPKPSPRVAVALELPLERDPTR